MNKMILVFAILLGLSTTAQKPCRRQCSPRFHSEIVCAQDKDGRNCRKLKECELRELNCRLRSRKQSMLMQTYMQRCRFIPTKTGRNKCAPPLVMMQRSRRHPRKASTMMRDCYHLRCWDNNKRSWLCYRCPYKGDICQLLTACQAKRANCKRRCRKQFVRADDQECEKIKFGQMKRCKS